MKEFMNPVWLSNIMKNPFQYARENEVVFYQHNSDRNSAGQPQYYCNLRPPYPVNYNSNQPRDRYSQINPAEFDLSDLSCLERSLRGGNAGNYNNY